nr:RNA-directed DNA polymerase, eukaryota, reverse transcriptase zinc-binding domain protein [Tanacetum cinerariifolium]
MATYEYMEQRCSVGSLLIHDTLVENAVASTVYASVTVCGSKVDHKAINTRPFNLEKHAMVVEGEKKNESQGGLGLTNLLWWNKALKVKHLWNIENKKDTLWVRWVNTVKLRGVSIWVVQREDCDSWGWKNLLAIRDLIRDHALYKTGNEESTHMWYDNWSGLGPLINFITHRDLYNARLNKDSCVADMISNGAWKIASEWVGNLSFLSTTEVPDIRNGEKDKVAWLDKNGKKSKNLQRLKKEWQSLLQTIHDIIKARMMGLMVKAVETAAAIWEVKLLGSFYTVSKEDKKDLTKDMDFFSLISAPNPTKVKTETRPRAAHEVPLLTATANCVIDMEDMTGASGFSGTPSNRISPTGNPPYTEVAPEPDMEKEMVAMGALVNKRRRKRGPDEAEANAPPKVLRKDHVASHLSQSTLERKLLAVMGIETGSTVFAHATQETLIHAEGVSDPDPLSYAKPPPASEKDIAQSSRKAVVTEDPNSEKSASFTFMVGSPGESSSSSSPTGSEDPGQGKTHKNLEALLEAEVDIKDIAEAKNVELAQVTGEKRIKAAFKEFKKYEDDHVSSRCAEIDARLDALSIDFDEELYPCILTAIAGRRWVIGHGLRIAIMMCAESTELRHVFAEVVSAGISKGMSEGLKHGVEHEKAKVVLTAIEAYDPEADTKYVAAFYALKDLKYPLVDQLEKLKDAPIDVIMSSLYLESDSGEDAPQLIRELRHSSSQLKIPLYPEVRNPKDP